MVEIGDMIEANETGVKVFGIIVGMNYEKSIAQIEWLSPTAKGIFGSNLSFWSYCHSWKKVV
jgi:hypothetical protein